MKSPAARLLSVLSCVLIASAVPAAPQSYWATTGNMTIARAGHIQVLLADGKILVAGGASNGVTLASAEIYDPTKHTWSPTGSMTTPRTAHAAALLPNGDVLVAGGTDAATVLKTAEIYNPSTGAWSATGSMNIARTAFTLSAIDTGRMLAAAGCPAIGCNYSTALASSELYNPATAAWTLTGSLSQGRFGQTAVVLNSGIVMLTPLTGTNFIGDPEIYQPASGKWSAAGSTSYQYPSYATAVKLFDGRVLMIGGYPRVGNFQVGTEVYDPVANSWAIAGNLAHLQLGESATLLATGQALLAGGGYYIRSAGRRSFVVPDPASQLYSEAPATFAMASYMTTLQASAPASLLPDGTVLVSGGIAGINATAAVNSAELYLPATLTLSPSSLAFSGQILHTPGVAQTVTLANPTHVSIGLEKIAAAGDFAQTNNCPASLAPLQSCKLAVIFTPTAAGARTGAATLTLNYTPFSVPLNLTGTGLDKALIPSVNTLSFSTVAHTSTSTTFTMANIAPTPVAGSIAISGTGFSQTNNCPPTFAAGQSCSVKVLFSPAATGNFTGTLTVTGTPGVETVALSGTSLPVALNVSPPAIDFGSLVPGDSSDMSITVSNATAIPIQITKVTLAGAPEFTADNQCPSPLAAGANCTIAIYFAPTANGQFSSVFTLIESSGTAHVVPLQGVASDNNN